jgi:hypothetical protein
MIKFNGGFIMGKKLYRITFTFVFMILMGCFCFIVYNDYIEVIKENKSDDVAFKEENTCEFGVDTSKEETELNDYVSNYDVSVYYEELDNNYVYKYNEDEKYYGASLIKLVDALYLIDNKIDLNATMKYEKKYYDGVSECMSGYHYGDEISLNTLITCAISVSDNTAHMMLISYIGFDNLKNYGESLGATNILDGGDNFGTQSAKDINIYLKRLYELKNYSDSKYLFKIMQNNEFGFLNIGESINVSHKYGQYDVYFHDVGITFDTHPYTISVLTRMGNENYDEVIQEISQKVAKIHTKYWSKCLNN